MSPSALSTYTILIDSQFPHSFQTASMTRLILALRPNDLAQTANTLLNSVSYNAFSKVTLWS